MSLLPQLSSYSGMILVGLFIPLILRRKNRVPEYKGLFVEEGDHSIQVRG
jgi:hypothetical protein